MLHHRHGKAGGLKKKREKEEEKETVEDWSHRTEKWSDSEQLMMMNMEQGSTDWHEMRNRRTGALVTTSNFGPAIGLGDFERNGAHKLWERLISGKKKEFKGFIRMIMNHGTTFEPFVRNLYEQVTGYTVLEVGYAVSNKYPWIAASSDGYVFENAEDAVCQTGESLMDVLARANGLVEIKVPSRSLPTSIKNQYMAQIQGQMYLCDKPWCDVFISHISMKGAVREVHVPLTRMIRVYRDKKYWRWMCTRLKYFVKCVETGQAPDLNNTSEFTQDDWDIIEGVMVDEDPLGMFEDWDDDPDCLVDMEEYDEDDEL